MFPPPYPLLLISAAFVVMGFFFCVTPCFQCFVFLLFPRESAQFLPFDSLIILYSWWTFHFYRDSCALESVIVVFCFSSFEMTLCFFLSVFFWLFPWVPSYVILTHRLFSFLLWAYKSGRDRPLFFPVICWLVQHPLFLSRFPPPPKADAFSSRFLILFGTFHWLFYVLLYSRPPPFCCTVSLSSAAAIAKDQSF